MEPLPTAHDIERYRPCTFREKQEQGRLWITEMRTWLVGESNGENVRHLKDVKYGEKTNGEASDDM